MPIRQKKVTDSNLTFLITNYVDTQRIAPLKVLRITNWYQSYHYDG